MSEQAFSAAPAAKTLVADEVRETWREMIARYQEPSTLRSSWQLLNTLVPYFLMCYAMYRSLEFSYWLTLALAVPTAGFLIRIFVISHDCGHGSFFRSAKANTFWGTVTSFLCINPYYYWKHEHALHHASTGNLDRRGHGDIWTMTVQEYLDATPRRRLAYRIYRNPFVMFAVGAFFVFLVDYRFAPKWVTAKERTSIRRMNVILLLMLVGVHFTIGIPTLLMLQLPVIALSAAGGAWLFYVQHQYEGVYWARKDEWDFVAASLDGSSYFKLPAVLQWFTGNIGFHHIHHLSSKIPNYNLPRCHRENPVFQKVRQITFFSSFQCLKYRFWDEERSELVGYDRLRELMQN